MIQLQSPKAKVSKIGFGLAIAGIIFIIGLIVLFLFFLWADKENLAAKKAAEEAKQQEEIRREEGERRKQEEQMGRQEQREQQEREQKESEEIFLFLPGTFFSLPYVSGGKLPTLREFVFETQGFVTNMGFLLVWNADLPEIQTDALILKYRLPDGTFITPANAKDHNIYYVRQLTYQQYRGEPFISSKLGQLSVIVEDPYYIPFTLSISKLQTSTTPSHILSVDSKTDENQKIWVDFMVQKIGSEPTDYIIAVRILNELGKPVLKAKIDALYKEYLCEGFKYKTSELSLNDDGILPDKTPGNGVYSGIYSLSQKDICFGDKAIFDISGTTNSGIPFKVKKEVSI